MKPQQIRKMRKRLKKMRDKMYDISVELSGRDGPVFSGLRETADTAFANIEVIQQGLKKILDGQPPIHGRH